MGVMRQGSSPTHLLAQASGSASVWVWSLVLIGFLVFLFAVVTFIRKWMRDEDTPSSGPAFTLGDLRDLHKRGQMTDDEYTRAKAALVATIKPTAHLTSDKQTTDQPVARPAAPRDTPG